MTYYMAGEGRRLFGQTTPSELPNKFAMSVRQSIGVCGMITPWNFPMAIPSWKMMPALISGNTVVLKPAEDTPLSSYHLVQVLTEAGVPSGVVNLVSGDGPGAGAPLSASEDVPVVSFTGSTAVGRLIAEACAPTFKHCSLEMGGKNIIIVMEDANLDLAVDGAVWGGFGTPASGAPQPAASAVHKSVYHEFIQRFVDRVTSQGARRQRTPIPEVDMGPCINEQQLQTVMSYVEIGKNEGAKLLTGGNRLDSGIHAKGWFHAPTVFGDCSPQMRASLRKKSSSPVVSRHSHRQLREQRLKLPTAFPTACPLRFTRAMEIKLFRRARSLHRHRLRERPDHRAPRNAPALRRHQTAQRPSGSRQWRPSTSFFPNGRPFTLIIPTESFSAPKSTTINRPPFVRAKRVGQPALTGGLTRFYNRGSALSHLT